MLRLAPAKLNLSLDVLGTRPDGFHAIRSVVQTVSLFDRIHLEPADDLVVESPIRPEAEDLVWRAARAAQAAAGRRLGARIRVEKEIPTGAGLGGGSSDAAQTLLGLRELWDLPLGDDELGALALDLGSDVPFFLSGGTALLEGRGEEIQALQPIGRRFFVILKPDEGLATSRVYARAAPGDGRRTRTLLQALRDGRLVLTGNDLEGPARSLLPSLDRLFRDLEGLSPQLTGSGSALFVPARTALEAEELARRWAGRIFARAVATVEEMPDGRANATIMGRNALAY